MSWNSPQTVAGRAILMEIGARAGIVDTLLFRREISVPELAAQCGVQESFVSAYYAALARAGLVQPLTEGTNGKTTRYAAAPDLDESVNEVGYVLWAIGSNAPLLENAGAFARDMPSAIDAHQRDGAHVARTSRWMGERDFYPHALRAILARRPNKIVDLGSGTCGLLMRCLRQLPGATGVGIDMSADACAKARIAVEQEGFGGRIEVIHAPVQTLVDDPTPVAGADVIHAGFVFHDLMPDEEATLDALLRTFRDKAPDGVVVVVDAVPYASNEDERSFSAAFTFLHSHFMGRRFPSEEKWKAKLIDAGYASVDVSRLGISGGRVFTAQPR